MPAEEVVASIGLSDVHTDLCELAHSLCEQRNIPVLVTDLIASHLDKEGLPQISQLSRDLNARANTIIYHHISLDFTDPPKAERKAALLLRTLLANKVIAHKVRKFSLIGDPLFQWRKKSSRGYGSYEAPIRGMIPPAILIDLSAFNLTEISLYRKIFGTYFASSSTPEQSVSVTELGLDIIRLTPRLEDLDIASAYFRYPDFREGLRAIGEAGALQHLRNSAFCLDLLDILKAHITAVLDWDDALLTPLLAPRVESVATVMAVKPHCVSSLRTTTITRLVMYHCQDQDSDFVSVLAATPRLRYLDYHASVGYSWCKPNRYGQARPGLLELEPLFAGLVHVSGSLEELVASQTFDEDEDSFDITYAAVCERPFRPRYELSTMKHLRSLTIPYLSILGWKPYTTTNFEWHKMLPTSLCEITLTDDIDECFDGSRDRWTDQYLMPIFEDLLDWLVTQEGVTFTPKFALLLRHAEEDFNESVREKMSMLCADRGIPCTIEKRYEDYT